jgi:hypothetical protein
MIAQSDVVNMRKICQSAWSEEFLHNTVTLIKQIKNLTYTVKQAPSHQQETLPLVSDRLLWNVFFIVLKDPSFVEKYLTKWQYDILLSVMNTGVIRTIDEFNYMLHHLPFYTEINEMLCNYIDVNIDIPLIYKKYILGSYVSPVIQNWMFTHCRYVDTYHVVVQTQPVVIDIVHSNHDDVLLPLVDEICRVNLMLRKTYQIPDTTIPLHIIFVMTPFKKKLNCFLKNEMIDQLLIKNLRGIHSLEYNYCLFDNPITNLNVNTGVTVHSRDSYITLWRTEEFTKVLIHELIHYYHLEKGDEFPPLELNISNNFRHASKELFTELQTWYIYTVYQLSHYEHANVQFILDYERTYALMVMHDILSSYGIHQLTQLVTADDRHKINVHSSVIYYYVFKAFMLSHVDPLLEKLLFPSRTCDECRHKYTILVRKRLTDLLHSSHLNTYLSKNVVNDHHSLRMMGLQLIPFC